MPWNGTARAAQRSGAGRIPRLACSPREARVRYRAGTPTASAKSASASLKLTQAEKAFCSSQSSRPACLKAAATCEQHKWSRHGARLLSGVV